MSRVPHGSHEANKLLNEIDNVMDEARLKLGHALRLLREMPEGLASTHVRLDWYRMRDLMEQIRIELKE